MSNLSQPTPPATDSTTQPFPPPQRTQQHPTPASLVMVNSGDDKTLLDSKLTFEKEEKDTLTKEEEVKSKKKKKKKGDETPPEPFAEDIELAELPPEYRRIIVEQTHVVKTKPVSFFGLYRFATPFEISLNVLGIFAAIAAGAGQPCMTLAFGALTNAFTDFGTVAIQAADLPNGQALFDEAKAELFRAVDKSVLYFVYIAVGVFVATYIYTASFIYTGEASARRIRELYMRACLRQNVGFYDKVGSGEIATRIENDCHLIQVGTSDKVALIAMHLSTFVSGFVIAFTRAPRIAGVMISVIPVMALAVTLIGKFTSSHKTRQLSQVGLGATLAEEVISSIRNTHAFGTQSKLVSLYDEFNGATEKLGIEFAKINCVGFGFIFFSLYSVYALGMWFGVGEVLNNRANAGQFISGFFAVLVGAGALAGIQPNAAAIPQAIAGATAVFATIDRRPIIDSASPEGLKPDTVQGDIQLTDVDFIYPARPSTQVLYKFSALIPHGKMTALVGGSGSGKSTIVSLVERFYDPVGGSIKIDGVEIKELNVKWLRTQIGLVSQEPTLFANTVAGNIEHGLIGSRFEHESAEERRARVIAAAKEANADDFISKLPDGYETMIGERGMLLSGGQKQRIAIARAIIGDPKILLMDEATSALDTASEAIVQEALDRAASGRTTIAIAHRLSTIKNADQIIVLTAGHILESATTTEEGSAHDILISKPDGAYSKLVRAQEFREATEEQEAEQHAEKIVSSDAPTLKRTATGRSAASEALAKRDLDLEGGNQGAKKRVKSIYLLRRMLSMNKDHWKVYIVGLFGSAIVGSIYPAWSIVMGGILGVFTTPTDTEEGRAAFRSGGNQYALYCVAIAIIAMFAMGLDNWCWSSTAEVLARRIRLQTFAALLRQDVSFFDKSENTSGALTANVSGWAQNVTNLLGVTSGAIVQSLFTFVVGCGVGLGFAWKVALVALACAPITVGAGIARLRIIGRKDERLKKTHATSSTMACEATGAIRTVASLTREEECSRIYSEFLDEPQRLSNQTALKATAIFAASQGGLFLVMALVFWFGARELGEGRIDSRQFFTAMIAIVFGQQQVGEVFNYVPDSARARTAAADFVALADSRPDIDAMDPDGKQLAATKGHLNFNNVHFRYPTRLNVRVLRGLDLEVLPGQFVAICGPSGGGKSTIIQLVERFYDPLSGSVTVDGEDISELNIKSYRESISLVSQEPTLYAGSVRFNITLGANKPAEQVTEAEVEQACRDANIHDFVMSLPDGYDTEVGGKGTQLSGGQKQRIAIARALIRNPKILLMDEATSALDSESERVVQVALDQAAKGRSTIAVAHRLSTIQHADVIYVLGEGRVVEKGSHFELLARKGVYSELVSQQRLEKRA